MRNYVAAAQHLAAAQQAGLCRHIGVTNFDVPRLKEMLDAGVRIVSNQASGAAGSPALQRSLFQVAVYVCAQLLGIFSER